MKGKVKAASRVTSLTRHLKIQWKGVKKKKSMCLKSRKVYLRIQM